jgi:hypothetical protein
VLRCGKWKNPTQFGPCIVTLVACPVHASNVMNWLQERSSFQNPNSNDRRVSQEMRLFFGCQTDKFSILACLAKFSVRSLAVTSGQYLSREPIGVRSFNIINSYVGNNPLSFTDPTGFSKWTEVRRPVMAIVAAAVAQHYVGLYALGQAAAFGPPTQAAIMAANAAGAAAGGFAAGGIMGGNLQSAIHGALKAAAFFGVGEGLGLHGMSGSDFLTGKHVGGIAAHGVVGCVAEAFAGGSCQSGAASAAFAKLGTPLIAEVGSTAGQVVAAAVMGGLGSVAGGGKFENGAVTGAFGYLFNHCGAGGCDGGNDEAALRMQGVPDGDWSNPTITAGDKAVLYSTVALASAPLIAYGYSAHALFVARKEMMTLTLELLEASSSSGALAPAAMSRLASLSKTTAGKRTIDDVYHYAHLLHTHAVSPTVRGYLSGIQSVTGVFKRSEKFGPWLARSINANK